MNQNLMILIIVQLPILLFSVIIHECAHGWMAEQCGDDTARMMGRITLNPIPHIDIMGTIILPLLFLASPTHVVFGYAKPVPVNPYRFHNIRRDTMIVSFSGPAANLLLATFFSIILRLLIALPVFSLAMKGIFVQLFSFGVFINIFLAIINLLPIPPLDGSGVVSGLLPAHLAYRYEQLRPYGFLILLFLLMSGMISRITVPMLTLLSHILLGGIML